MPETPKVHMGQSLFDLLFPKSLRVQVGLTDIEANALYTLWKNSPAGATSFAIKADMDNRTLTALKTKGYLAGVGGEIELTDKGKKVIVEMVTHEPNAFSKQASEISYSGIKSKSAANKRPRQAHVKKVASKNEKVFNLRKASLEKLKKELDENNDNK